MACCNATVTSSTTNNTNTIAGLLRRIDQMQKEALISNANALCESCLMSAMYNTKPLSVYLGYGLFEANIGVTEETTQYFRVEEVRGNDTVVLRLLVLEDGVLTCTNNTVVVNISCICAVQCFAAINCNLTNCNCSVEV